MTILLGHTVASMFDPPNDGTVRIDGQDWQIGRNGSGQIVLRRNGQPHPDFVAGMWMADFVAWINAAWRDAK